MTPKYELMPVREAEKPFYPNLFRLRALRNFGYVKAGALGGLVTGEHNLSHEGTCWIDDEATVQENARVTGNAIVKGNATVKGNIVVTGEARIRGWTELHGNGEIGGRISLNAYRPDMGPGIFNPAKIRTQQHPRGPF